MSDIDFKCPECNRKVGVTLKQVASQATVRCSAGHSIKLQDSGGGARKTQKAMDDLDKAIKKLGGR